MAQLPSEFQKIELLTELKNSVDFEFAPDGRIFLLDRYGEVIIYKPDTQILTTAGSLSVFSDLEDGLLAIEFDPDFVNNNYIYLHYSPLSTSVNRVSRFAMQGDQIDLASEVIVIEWPTQRVQCCHAAGDLDFDSNGNLFIATGDNTNHSKYAALDEVYINKSAENTSSNTNDLRGKILRINVQSDGSYIIPEGNLFPDGIGGKPEIYVMGARNPFKMFVDKENTNWLFWGDVGPDANFSSELGPEGQDEINLTKTAGNYGWPYFAGKNEAYQNTYSNPTFYYDPANPVNISKWNTGETNLPPAQPSWLEFFHESYMAGSRYYFDPSISNSKKLPIEFDKAFFYFDFNKSKVWVVELDDLGNIIITEELAPSIVTGAGFIDLEISPDGQIYILEYGAGCCPDNTGTGKLVRLDYIGISGNNTPIVQLGADKTSGSHPLTVNFSSEGTYDPDGDLLIYNWDFQSDGIIDSNEENPSFTFTEEGVFDVQLKVDDSNGGVSAKTIKINAGNNAATFEFVYPPDGAFFNWNDNVNYHFVVNDVEDGSTSDGTISCSSLNFIPSLGHLDHFHDDLAIHQCEGTLYLDPTDHDIEGQDDIFLVFNLNYTDNGGLTAYDQIKIYPKLQEAEFYDFHSNTDLISNSDNLGGGNYSVRALSHGSYIGLSGRNLLNINSVVYRVSSSLGGVIEIHADSPDGTLLSIAQVPVTGSTDDWVNIQAAVSDPGGKTDLYFVFKNNSGDVNLFDLNYIEFLGDGISTNDTPPDVSSINVESSNLISVKFNERMDKTSTETVSNYLIDKNVTINSAVLQSDARTIHLSTSTLASNIQYSLTINNVSNEDGIAIDQSIIKNFIYNQAITRINTGGPELLYENEIWLQSQYNSGGKTYENTSLAIENTSKDELYQSEIFSDFTLNIPVPEPGYYEAVLHFAEIYHGVQNSNGVGARVFNVSIEQGQGSLANFDIIEEAGAPATAIIKNFNGINVTDGFLTISFSSIVDNAKISAVELFYGQEQTGEPSIVITGPANGSTVVQPFNLYFEVSNWEVGQGTTHIHKIVDGVNLGGVYTTDPIPFTDLSIGSHTIELMLMNADHTPAGYSDQIQVNVVEQLECPEMQFPNQWAEQIIGNKLEYRSVYMYAADIDSDGLKDIVTGGWWFKNPGSLTQEWVKNTIGSPMNNMSLLYDFDNDGDIDVFGTQGTYTGAEMAWAENNGNGNFTIHTNIPAGSSTFSETFMAGAVIGKFNSNNLQIAMTWNGAEQSDSWVQLLTLPSDPVNESWTIESISPDSYGEAISAGDIDGDGDLDLFQAGNWLRNDNGNWTTFSTGITLPSHFDRNKLADIDGDGMLDGIVTQFDDNQEICWFKPPTDPTQPWTKITIGTDIDAALSLDLADMDSDGDLDVLTGEWRGSKRLLAFENDLCNSGTWIQHVLHTGTLDHHDGAQAFDLDNDSDLDIISLGWSNTTPRIYINNGSGEVINNPPTVNNPGDQIIEQGAEFSLQIEASDPDVGDILNYQANGLPASLQIDSSSGLISGTASADSGIYPVQVIVTDDSGSSASVNFNIEVTTQSIAFKANVNSGGSSFSYNNQNWLSDQYYSGGKTYKNTSPIENTDNDQLYQTERFGSTFSYNIPVPVSGEYIVILHFAELYWGTKKDGGVGSRVFNVSIEDGQQTLDNYDIYSKTGGALIATSETFTINVVDGELNIDFISVVENAKVSGIEVRSSSNSAPSLSPIGDQSVIVNNVLELNLYGSDPEGDNITYSIDPDTYPFVSLTDNGNGNGLLTISPIDGDQGNYSLTVLLTDVNGNFDSETIQITINSNNPPVLEPVGNQTVLVGQQTNLYLSSTDPENDAITYSIDPNNYSFLTLQDNLDGSAVLTFTPVSGDEGSYPLIITVSDDLGNSSSETIEIAITSGNPPVLSTIGDQTIVVGNTLIVELSATDSDGDDLTFSVDNPSNLSFVILTDNGDGTGQLSISPSSGDEGIYSLTVNVTDVNGNLDNETIQLTINSNNPPVLEPVGNQVVKIGKQLNVNLSSSDPENDAITYSIDPNNYSFLTLQDNLDGTALLTFNPVSGDEGSYPLTIIVSDNYGNSSSESIDITITSGSPPVLSAINNQAVTVGATLTVDLSATDSDGDNLIFSLDNPSNLASVSWTDNGDGTGYLFFDPIAGEEGSYILTVTVTDSNDLTDSESFTVEIIGNSPPVLSPIGDKTISVGQIVSVDLSATDPDLDAIFYSYDPLYSFVNLIDNSDGTGVLEFNPVSGDEGDYVLTVTVTDSEGNSDNETFNVSIISSTSTFDLKINSGGKSFTFNGENWQNDTYFNSGNTYTNPTTIYGTENDALYQKERWGSFSYAIPVPANGFFNVNLHFAEIFYGVKSSGGVGSRVFNVDVENGQGSLMNYDIIESAGGAQTAVVESFTVEVLDGLLDINFLPVIDNPKISGIEVSGPITNITSGRLKYYFIENNSESNELEKNSINLFPNPNNGSFSLSIKNPEKEPVNYMIFNSLGSLITEKVLSSDESINSNISLNIKGVYFFKLQIGNELIQQKIIVQ